ncbi:MAG: TrkA family potassium uptake protein [Propionibacteriales bacterium]|nr:TrkA family potassium uptake protein [Propionibacteriales bacterium]
MARRKRHDLDSVLVIGLGRFGTSVAKNLIMMDRDVLAIDTSDKLVERWSNELTHVVLGDATDEEVMRQLGAASFQTAVVGIGSDIEASVVSVLILAELGVPDIWAKAVTGKHAQILERVGAHHVVRPERAMGERVAHMVGSNLIDYMSFDDGYAIARTTAPAYMAGLPLSESTPRSRHGVTVVGIKRSGEDFINAVPETVVRAGDELVICATRELVEQFARLR